jgi:hypothetical protein
MTKKENEVINPVSIQNPRHYVPQEVTDALREMKERADAESAFQSQINEITRLTQEERAAKAALRMADYESAGIEPGTIEKLRDIGIKRSHRVKEMIDRRPGQRIHLPFPPSDTAPREPAASDNTFWWANSSFETDTPKFVGRFTGGILTVTGGIREESGDLQYRSFWLTALFAIQPERIPVSPSRSWSSTPPIDIFGDWLVSVGNVFGGGDQWVKCWMQRDQYLFQVGLGGDIFVGRAHEGETLVFEENSDANFHVYMKGSQLMPPVRFRDLNTINTLWCRLEVRFDFQTEGEGSLITIWNERYPLTIRPFQWPLVALP